MQPDIKNINGDFDHLLTDEEYNDKTETQLDEPYFTKQRLSRPRRYTRDCFVCRGIGCSHCGETGTIIIK